MPGWDKMLPASPDIEPPAAGSPRTRRTRRSRRRARRPPMGTVEPWVRDYLRARGVLGTSIFWFELDRDSNGCPLPAERWLIPQPRRDAGGYVLHRPAPPTGSDPIKARRGKSARCGRRRLFRRPVFADQPKRPRRAVFSRRSAALATLSAGLVIRVATSRARVTHCGVRMERRSATSDSWVVAEKGRAEPTFSRVTAAAQLG